MRGTGEPGVLGAITGLAVVQSVVPATDADTGAGADAVAAAAALGARSLLCRATRFSLGLRSVVMGVRGLCTFPPVGEPPLACCELLPAPRGVVGTGAGRSEETIQRNVSYVTASRPLGELIGESAVAVATTAPTPPSVSLIGSVMERSVRPNSQPVRRCSLSLSCGFACALGQISKDEWLSQLDVGAVVSAVVSLPVKCCAIRLVGSIWCGPRLGRKKGIREGRGEPHPRLHLGILKLTCQGSR